MHTFYKTIDTHLWTITLLFYKLKELLVAFYKAFNHTLKPSSGNDTQYVPFLLHKMNSKIKNKLWGLCYLIILSSDITIFLKEELWIMECYI